MGPKADIALIVADEDAVVGGAFTQNVMCAAPVIYCKEVMARKSTCRAVSLFSALRRMCRSSALLICFMSIFRSEPCLGEPANLMKANCELLTCF